MRTDYLEAFAQGDLDQLIQLMRALYEVDDVKFDETNARAAVLYLMQAGNQRFGRILVRRDDSGTICGYLVLTFGFSLEYGGLHGFVDEFYLRPEQQGRGGGTAMLSQAVELCRELNLKTLLLEVDLKNERAHRFYERLGFRENPRRLMALHL